MGYGYRNTFAEHLFDDLGDSEYGNFGDFVASRHRTRKKSRRAKRSNSRRFRARGHSKRKIRSRKKMRYNTAAWMAKIRKMRGKKRRR